MSKILLFETIKIEDGKIFNLPYHQARLDKSSKTLWNPRDTNIILSSIIDPPKKGLHRCRVCYSNTLHSIEYIPYIYKEIKTIKIVSASIDYAFKYVDRTEINALLALHTQADDILIEKNGYLSDTSIANIAFYDGSKWFTPSNPLLEGTMRNKLISEGFLHTKKIKKEEINNYSQVALMNAMLGFKIISDLKIR
ncbi:MAG: hypothetical protein DRQ78_01590 [Epsilonproteobacteria bacterium]|nr:MAG: hypothetical protein DRQ78_01590 [Campylobacterota bacterium]